MSKTNYLQAVISDLQRTAPEPFHGTARRRNLWLQVAGCLVGLDVDQRSPRERPMANHAEITLAHAAYGRFSRRLRAFLIDWIIIVLSLTAVLFLVISADSDQIGRVVGLTFAAVWLLYEPLLVSLTGSTVGHYLTNLRVVDDSTHGNPGFMKAVTRHLIKHLLGIYSFVTMATTSRHQAVHDLLTRSTVQVRNRSKARVDDYVAERMEVLSPSMPSRIRRIAFILSYNVLLFLLYGLLSQLISESLHPLRSVFFA